MAHRSGLRASDEDRERIGERLRQAAAEGRLVAEELEQRMATALRARTYGELDAVVADLPGERVARSRRGQRSVRPQHVHPAAAVALVVAIPIIVAAVIAVAVVLMTFVMFWAVVAVVSWRLVGHRHGIPAPWAYALRHQDWRRRHLRAERRNVVGSFVPWL
jgi:hypothetical protein